MTGTIEALAGKLAEDTMTVMDETAASQSLEEAYLTEVRVRLAERTARRFLAKKLADARAKTAPPPAG